MGSRFARQLRKKKKAENALIQEVTKKLDRTEIDNYAYPDRESYCPHGVLSSDVCDECNKRKKPPR